MKYIEKVILENFQSHKYTELEFDKNLNVIVGPSDQGKSAIIRGIKWALFNEPSGDYFIREGEKECSVSVFFSDKTKIKRYRSKSKNLYYLYDKDDNEKIYEGFGTNVPEEITKSIGIEKIYLDGKQSNSVNISDQLEGPFLISEKAVTRANAIGRLVGVNIVDEAISSTLKDVRSLNITRKSLEDQLNSLNDSLKQYDYLDDLRITINSLEYIKNNIKAGTDKLEKLKELKDKYNYNKSEIFELKLLYEQLSNINNVEYINEKLNTKINKYKIIKEKHIYLSNIKSDISHNNIVVNSLQDIGKINQAFIKLSSQIKTHEILKKLNIKYKRYIEDYNYNKRIIDNLQRLDDLNAKTILIDKYTKRISSLLNLKIKIEDLNRRIAAGSSYLERFSDINEIDKFTTHINQKIILLSKLINAKEKYEKVYKDLNTTVENINKEKNKMSILLNEYKNLLKKFEVCPLCFNKIDSESIKNIINNYR